MAVPPPVESANADEVTAAVAALLAAGTTAAAVKTALASLAGIGELSFFTSSGLGKLVAAARHDKAPKASKTVRDKIRTAGAKSKAAARATYLVKATQRLSAAYATKDKAIIGEARKAETKLMAAHNSMQVERGRAEKLLIKVVGNKKIDANGELLLGWYAHISDNTCARCLLADGSNFNALKPPPIGWPGTVHPHDHCLPGPAHKTLSRVEEVDVNERTAQVRAAAKRRSTAMTAETRTIQITEVRGAKEGEVPGFTARVVNYGVPDTFRTSWKPGVFSDAMAERSNMPVVWNHDWADPVGHVVAYRDSSDGLDVDVELDDFDAVPRAKQAYAQIKSGTMSQYSFAFVRGDEEQDPNHRGVMLQTRAGLQEFSLVLNGSVPGTHTTAVRSSSPGTVESAKAADIVTRFAAGTLKLEDALLEIRSAQESETRAPKFEFRALDGSGTSAEGSDPTAVLAAVDAAMSGVADQLDKVDVEAARRYFSEASSRLCELQYLLGMTPGLTESYAWRTVEAAETRTEEDGLLPDTEVEGALLRLAQMGRRR